MHARLPIALALLLLLGGCTNVGRTYEHRFGAPEAVSLLGAPLAAPPLDDETRARYRTLLGEAERAYAADPHDEDAIIWLGRRTAYLGRYQEAIAIFSEGLRVHPFSPRLLRHRGHRHLTVREIDRAIADLARAAKLIAGQPDEVEPDGLPNRLGIPRSTTQTNIWYHLGLAHYLTGRFGEAADAFSRCLDRSRNDDMRVAASYWLYLSRARAGEEAEARAVLEPISREMDVIENDGYHRLLLLYRGELDAADLDPGPATVDDATVAYGVAAWHLLSGRDAEARRRFEALIAGPAWPAFGHLAAEAELARDRE